MKKTQLLMLLPALSLGCVVRPDAALPPWDKTSAAALWLPPERERRGLIFRHMRGGSLPAERPVKLYIRPLSVDFNGCRGRHCELVAKQMADALPAFTMDPPANLGICRVATEDEADWILESRLVQFDLKVFWAFSYFDLIPSRQCTSELWHRILDRRTSQRLWWNITLHFTESPLGQGPQAKNLAMHLRWHRDELADNLRKALYDSQSYPGKP